MIIQLKIISIDNIEQININADDKNNFFYVDCYGAFNEINVLEKGIKIKRKDKDHLTELFLTKDNSYIKINSVEGNLFFDTKVIEFNKNNDIILLVYRINDDIRKIEIKYIGV